MTNNTRILSCVFFYLLGAAMFLSGTNLSGTVGGFILLSFLINVLNWEFVSKREEYAAIAFFVFLGFDLVYVKTKLYGNYSVPFKHYAIGYLFVAIFIYFLNVILGPVVKSDESKTNSGRI